MFPVDGIKLFFKFWGIALRTILLTKSQGILQKLPTSVGASIDILSLLPCFLTPARLPMVNGCFGLHRIRYFISITTSCMSPKISLF